MGVIDLFLAGCLFVALALANRSGAMTAAVSVANRHKEPTQR
jgi:hypothetical protein